MSVSRTLWAGVALVALLAGLPAPVAAGAQPSFVAAQVGPVDAATDPVGAAIAWSTATFSAARSVVIAQSGDGADALASGLVLGGRAGQSLFEDDGFAITADGQVTRGRPLLLVSGPDDVADGGRVAMEIERLGATAALILGGEAVVPADVEAALSGRDMHVVRVSGPSRVHTAKALYDETRQGRGPALVARAYGTEADPGSAYADSVAAATLAGTLGKPILLAAGDSIAPFDDFTIPGDLTAVGGPAAVSQAWMDAAADAAAVYFPEHVAHSRLAGATRHETATALNDLIGQSLPLTIGGPMANDPDVWRERSLDSYVLVDSSADNYWIDAFAAVPWAIDNDAQVVHANIALADSPVAQQPPTRGDGKVGLLCGTTVSVADCRAYADLVGADVVPLPDPVEVTDAVRYGRLIHHDRVQDRITLLEQDEQVIYDAAADLTVTFNGALISPEDYEVVADIAGLALTALTITDGQVTALEAFGPLLLAGRSRDIDLTGGNMTIDLFNDLGTIEIRNRPDAFPENSARSIVVDGMVTIHPDLSGRRIHAVRWADDNGPSRRGDLQVLAAEDPDGDGVVNYAEFIVGGVGDDALTDVDDRFIMDRDRPQPFTGGLLFSGDNSSRPQIELLTDIMEGRATAQASYQNGYTFSIRDIVYHAGR